MPNAPHLAKEREGDYILSSLPHSSFPQMHEIQVSQLYPSLPFAAHCIIYGSYVQGLRDTISTTNMGADFYRPSRMGSLRILWGQDLWGQTPGFYGDRPLKYVRCCTIHRCFYHISGTVPATAAFQVQTDRRKNDYNHADHRQRIGDLPEEKITECGGTGNVEVIINRDFIRTGKPVSGARQNRDYTLQPHDTTSSAAAAVMAAIRRLEGLLKKTWCRF